MVFIMQKIIILTKKIIAKLPVILFDVAAIPVAWYAAYWLRYNMQPYPGSLTSTHSFIALAL
ncbi:TPA: hypothetical protein ACH3KA_000435, partial [Legionella pneumophila]